MSQATSSGDHLHAGRPSAPEGDPAGPAVTVQAAYTLCTDSEPLRAVTAVGTMEAASGRNDHVAYFTDSLSAQTVVAGRDLVPLGVQPPTPTMTVVPILSRLLTTLDEGDVDMGWRGYHVGSRLTSSILQALAPFIGARRMIDYDLDHPETGGAGGAGRDVFLVTDPEPGRLTSLLAAMPEGSLLAMLVPPAGPSQQPVNFYETVHKKSLTLLGNAEPGATTHERAVRLAGTRLSGLAAHLPVRGASEDGSHPGDGHPGVILEW